MANNVFIKDPNAKVDFGIRWAEWLDGDTIQSAAWTVPAGLTNAAESYSSDTAYIWLSGGTAGSTYPVQCRISTVGGRIDDRTIQIIVKER